MLMLRADEAPLCQITEGTVAAPVSCSHTSAKSMPGNFCKADPGNAKSCGRYNEFNQLDTQVSAPSQLADIVSRRFDIDQTGSLTQSQCRGDLYAPQAARTWARTVTASAAAVTP